MPASALRSASLRSASLRCAEAGKTGGEAGEAEDIPLFFTWIPILALLSNYDQEICLIHVGTEGFVFRGDNESSNPVTIFEFKKPQRDDFVNKSSDEDPVEQIGRYVNNIVDGKFKTPEGMKILVAPNTPFYGFVVCDLTAKVERWLEREKDFKPMPDRQGWFDWKQNINLYIEVVSWEKVLKDAQMRNKVFFHKLGI